MKIEHSIVIDRPLAEVFEYLTNIENHVKWRAGLVEAEKTSDGPIGVGSTGREVATFLGKRMETTFELTEFKPNSVMAFKSTSGPMPLQGRQTFEEVSGGTKVNFKIEGESGGLFKLAGPMLKGMASRQIETDFANLKDLLESRG